MSQLAEAYFRLAIRLEPEDRIALQAYLTEFADAASRGLFQQTPEIAATLDQGSLKGWVKALGALYVVIAGYGSFRSGIDYLVQDAEKFSHAVISTVLSSGISSSEVLRVEHRTGVPGRLQRALRRVDQLRSRRAEISSSSYLRQLAEIRREFGIALSGATHYKDKSLIVQNLPSEVREAFPKRLPRPSTGGTERAVLRPEEFQEIEASLIEVPARRITTREVAPSVPTRKPRRQPETLYRVRKSREGFWLEPR